MSFANNIKQLRKSLQLTQTEFAEKIGKTMRTVQTWESSQNEPSITTIRHIAAVFHVSPDSLILYDNGNVHDQKMVKTTVSVPYYDHVHPSAGYGINIFNEQADGIMEMPYHLIPYKQGISSMLVKGDSMSPVLDDGDRIFVNLDEKTICGEGIYVIRWEDALLVKTVQKIKNGIRLISSNPKFDTLEFTGEECENMAIVGRVIGIFSKL